MGINTSHESHEGHDHPFISPELIEALMKEIDEAEIIENLFIIPLNTKGLPRFVLAQVDREGNVHTFGYIPFDMMLDVGVGFIQAVKNFVQLHIIEDATHPKSDEERPLAGGLFKVI